MDMETFCDKFCPMPFRGTDRYGNQEVDCDLEMNDCPFKDVDFSKVHEFSFVNYEIHELLTGDNDVR